MGRRKKEGGGVQAKRGKVRQGKAKRSEAWAGLFTTTTMMMMIHAKMFCIPYHAIDNSNM